MRIGRMAQAWGNGALGMLVALFAFGAQAAAGEDAARGVVERLQAALLEAMRTEDVGTRRALLAPVVEETHDLDGIARVAVGRTLWKSFSPAQRARYLELFRKMSIASYVRAFSGYSGERFEVLSTQPVRNMGLLVRTRLYKPDGRWVQLDYHLRQRDGRWRIVNVVSDGVSDLALKRDQFRSIVETQGIESLLEELQAQSEPQAPRPAP